VRCRLYFDHPSEIHDCGPLAANQENRIQALGQQPNRCAVQIACSAVTSWHTIGPNQKVEKFSNTVRLRDFRNSLRSWRPRVRGEAGLRKRKAAKLRANRARVTRSVFAYQSDRQSHRHRSEESAIQSSSEAPRIAPGSPRFLPRCHAIARVAGNYLECHVPLRRSRFIDRAIQSMS